MKCCGITIQEVYYFDFQCCLFLLVPILHGSHVGFSVCWLLNFSRPLVQRLYPGSPRRLGADKINFREEALSRATSIFFIVLAWQGDRKDSLLPALTHGSWETRVSKGGRTLLIPLVMKNSHVVRGSILSVPVDVRI